MGFPDGSDGKAPTCNAGDQGPIPGFGISSGEENGNTLQYSCLENSMDREPGGLQSIAIIVNKRVQNAVLGYSLTKERMISVLFQGKPFTITVIPVYALTSNAEAEVERFYEDLQDLLKLTHKKDVIFIIVEWNAKEGSQEIPEVTGKFGLGVQN